MSLKDIEQRVMKLEDQCARYDERIDDLQAGNKELKDHLDKQDEGQEQFKDSMFDKMNAQRSLIITTLVGVIVAIVGSVAFVAISRLW
jgi:SMC interacting uncharacterized protein involved in chromosome segregation